ncbi:MAG: ribosome silencing factor [Ruminococcaceae bacterium]|nr:ribosome silencing factor [Oscillospiraceae bacterium]
MNSKELMALIVKALDDKKAKDIEVLSMEGISDIGDYFIIATGNSTTQLKALADAAEEMAARNEITPHHSEGYQTAIWILQDYGDVVLHIFNTETRGFYSLEHLWADATRVDISEILTQEEGGNKNG